MSTLSKSDVSAIIEMAWDDETSFDAIKAQTGYSEKQVIALMRREMKPSSFRMWRKRVTGRASKHRAKTR
ncbi:MAG: TIGR03643 family protein [Pseudomonadota bacterium]